LLIATVFAPIWAGTAAEPVQRTERVMARDGVALATDVYLPQAEGSFPAILLRTPYNKDAGRGFAAEAARRGYAVVVQDTRGRFGSEGENLPFDLDGPDGQATITWIERQPWFNGKLGTWGGSAGAITQFQLATAGDPRVDAQFLIVGAPNLYDVIYLDGVFRKALIEDWLRQTRFASNALDIWVSHARYDEYWRARDASLHYHRVNAPAVHIGGWWDIFAQSTIDAFVGYQTQGGEGARGRQKLIMGPWAHAVLQEKVGDLSFPNGKNPPGDTEDAGRWFDRWLRGLENGADQDPAVVYYVLGDTEDPEAPGNEWRTASAWPPVRTTAMRYFLRGDRSLSTREPGSREPLEYVHDPEQPVPTIGGIQLTLPAGPLDQRPIESRPDVLVFTSEPLSEPVEVTGRVRARIWISSDAPDTDFIMRLCDVYPDGRSYNLCEGMIRTRFRDGVERESLLTPGEVTPLEIDLWSTSAVFNRGHRIRVHLASSSAPGFDPNPGTGEEFRASTRTRKATNRLLLGPDHPSHILLPVASASTPATGRAGIDRSSLFSKQADIGDTAHAGSARFDPETAAYVVSGGGANMWSTNDAFHFLWNEFSGDLALTADIEWLQPGGDPHRKAVLLIRQGLEPDAAYADAALHGDGLASLQFRDTRGGPTREIQSRFAAPRTLRLERRGEVVSMWVAPEGGELRPAGGSYTLSLRDPILVGIGVCAHDNSRLETARFTRVELESLPRTDSSRQVLESTLETVQISSGDRRAIHHARDHLEAPNWSPDGQWLLYNSRGRLYRLPANGGEPERVNTGSAVRCNNDHGYSPDGAQLAISDQTETGRSLIYVLPAAGGSPRRVTALEPSYWHGWSPDGAFLAYCAERNGEFDIYTIPVTGGQEIRLTTAPGLDDGPDYSPDGKWIYFNSERTGLMQIWRMRPDGSQQEQVTHNDLNHWFPHPSPDGRWLVFLTYARDVKGHPANHDVELRIMPLAGGPVRTLARLFGGQGTINVPSWSPDSRKVAFMSYRLVPHDS
jgi:predicted acyl esterase/Tol biopolymer transport system component